MLDVIVIVLALGALPALLVWTVAYIVVPNKPRIRIAAVAGSAVLAIVLQPWLLLFLPSLLVFIFTISALEIAAKVRFA